MKHTALRCSRGGVWATACLLVVGVARTPAGAQANPEADAASRQLKAAHGLLERGLTKLAAQEYEAFLAQHGAHEQATTARYWLGECRRRMGQFGEAAALLEQVLKDAKFAERDAALAVLGHCRLKTGDHAKALAALEELLRQHPASAHAEVAALNQAEALHLMGRHADAVTVCQAFLQKYPASSRRPSAEYSLALAQYALGKHAEAAEVAARLLRQPASPLALDATLLLGRCQEQLGNCAEAAKHYQAAVQLAPAERKTEIRYSLGVALYKAGDLKQAAKTFSDALAADPSGEHAGELRLQLGLCHLAAGKLDEARKVLSAVVKDDKDRRVSAMYALARCDMTERKFDQARKTLDELAKDKPANLQDVLYDRAVCAMSLGEHGRAAAEFDDFRKAYPKDERLADATYGQAFCLHKLGKYADSLPLCRQAASQDRLPIAPAAADLAAENLFLLVRYDEAEEAFGKLAAGADDDRKRRIAFRLTQCACARADYARAIQLAAPLAEDKEALRDPALRQAVFLLGEAQLQSGQHREAARTLARYLPLAGDDRSEAQCKLGLAQLRAGEDSAAALTFESLFRKDESSEWAQRAMLEYAQLCYRRKEGGKAEPVLTKLLAGKPAEELAAPAAHLQAWIDYDAQRCPEAARRFGELVQRHPKHALAEEAAYQQGVCLVEAGRTAEALEALRKYLKDRPEGKHAAGARHQAGRCLAALGRHEEAAKELAGLASDKKAVTPDLLYELARAQRESKNEAAAATYRRLAAEFPDGKLAASARTELAELLHAQRKYAEAAALLEKVVSDRAADPRTLAVARYRLGWCYDELNEPAKAAAVFGELASRDADSEFAPSAMYQAGVAYAKLDKLDDAQKQFSALLAKFPDHDLAPVTMLKLGEVLSQGQDYEKSAEAYRRFLDKLPDDKFAFLASFGVGWSLENRRKYEEARQWYEKVIARHNGPTAARAQFQIGECHFAEGRYEKAVAELLKVDIVYAHPEWAARALYEAGRAFEAMKQPDEARKQYAACARKYKDEPAGQHAARRLKEMEEGK